MPTYQYACTDCDHAFEQVQSFSDDSLTVCPACEGRLRKIFNAVGVVFKGSGFYRTDSRADTAAKATDGKPADGKSAGTKEGTNGSAPAKTESSGSTPTKGQSGGAKSEAGAA